MLTHVLVEHLMACKLLITGLTAVNQLFEEHAAQVPVLVAFYVAG